jgi:hypothetical protein
MKTFQSLLLLLISFSLHAQSITFGPLKTLFALEPFHNHLSQPMMPYPSQDGKHYNYYGLTYTTYNKYTYNNGSYTASPFMLLGDFSYIMDVRDFDKDGKEDLLTDYVIYRQESPLSFKIFRFPNLQYKVEGLLDYDGDGLDDVVVTLRDFFDSKSTIHIQRNKGNLQFETIEVETGKGSYFSYDFNDVNGDGRDDILATAYLIDENPAAWVFLSLPGNTFEKRAIPYKASDYSPYILSLHDTDRDGDSDILLGDADEKTVWLFKNTDNYLTSLPVKAASVNSGERILSIHLSDLNKDGYDELIITTLTDIVTTIYAYPGNATGWASPVVIGKTKGGPFFNTPVTKAVTRLLQILDLDGDGRDDISYCSTIDGKLIAFYNTTLTDTDDSYDASISIGPVPFSDNITINTDLPADNIQWIDMAGRRIDVKPMSGSGFITYDTTTLLSGLYKVNIRALNGKMLSKVVLKSEY